MQFELETLITNVSFTYIRAKFMLGKWASVYTKTSQMACQCLKDREKVQLCFLVYGSNIQS